MSVLKRILLSLLIISTSTAFAQPLAEIQKPNAAKTQPAASWVDKTLASMSLDERVGQLIIPATIGMFLAQDSETFQQIKRDITEFHVGGYHVLGDVTSLHEPAGVALLLNHLQELAKAPLLITADLEGGAGWRYSGGTRLPRAMVMGATGSEDFAYQAARITAAEARAVGVHVNFYPVVDVNNNAQNPIINIRSFGSDPALVGRMARAYIRGAQANGVLATAKHFPGHGDTSTDSHLELPSVDVERSRLDAIELPPFKSAVDEGVAGVMSAHIALPRIEAAGLPATLSSKMLTGVLRGEMGFKGIIFTDAMNMRGVADHYPEGEAAVRAVKAGADVVLYPPSVEKAFTGLKRAVESGELTEARINESVRRILTAKASLGLDKNRFTDLNKVDRVLGSLEHQRTARQIMENGVTLVRDTHGVLPLKLKSDQTVLLITVIDSTDGWAEGPPGRTFLSALTARHPKTINVRVSDKTSPGEFDLLKKLAALSDVVIANGFIRVSAFKGSISLSEGQLDLLKYLSASRRPFAFVLFGSPYLISFVPQLPTYVLAYEYYPAAEEASLKAVLGEIEFRGRLPIQLPGMYEVGHSVATPRPALSSPSVPGRSLDPSR